VAAEEEDLATQVLMAGRVMVASLPATEESGLLILAMLKPMGEEEEERASEAPSSFDPARPPLPIASS
jgi:hypothetical protein